jgi:hypothetical protein
MASANNAPPPAWEFWEHKATSYDQIKDLESGVFNSLDPFQPTLGIIGRVVLLIPLTIVVLVVYIVHILLEIYIF